jgi:hypothetical protein
VQKHHSVHGHRIQCPEAAAWYWQAIKKAVKGLLQLQELHANIAAAAAAAAAAAGVLLPDITSRVNLLQTP